MRIWRAKALQSSAVLLTCLLSACSTDTVEPTKVAPLANSPKHSSESVALATVLPTPKPKDVKPEIDDDPDQLLGLSSSGVSDHLGLPNFIRRDVDAEIWQYLSEACILDVFLYSQGGIFTVEYVELRGRGAETLPLRNCFVSMLRAKLRTKQD